MNNLFQAAIRRQNFERPPVWFMRQAGRYHSHYQKLRARHAFMDLCKKPDLACEVTMGPIEDFDFDAAILFSDLLFPLEVLGMGLEYSPGPKLGWHLKTPEDLRKLRRATVSAHELARELNYQADAMRLIRARLPASKGLLGFVGGPLTLFCYAVEGSHQGGLESSRAGLKDGRYAGFVEMLLDLLAENMALQARAGADTVAILDTCAGEFDAETYTSIAVPTLRELIRKFKALCPETPVTYYSKGSGPAHWRALDGLAIACLGIDWKHNIASVLREFGSRYAIQGNVDPEWLFLEPSILESRLRAVFDEVKALGPEARRGWVCGLGHGVLQKTPESSVRLFLRLQRELFSSATDRADEAVGGKGWT